MQQDGGENRQHRLPEKCWKDKMVAVVRFEMLREGGPVPVYPREPSQALVTA